MILRELFDSRVAEHISLRVFDHPYQSLSRCVRLAILLGKLYKTIGERFIIWVLFGVYSLTFVAAFSEADR